MLFTRVGRHGRIIIPKRVREKIGLDEGDRIVFVVDGAQVIIKPIRQTLLDLRGSVPVTGEQDFDAIRKQVVGISERTGIG